MGEAADRKVIEIDDARTQLEARSFDVVLCEQDFAGTDYSGQQLLDDLRRHQLLPLSTVFIMITGEASYDKVAEAAESALDGYLLKPHTATSLAERLRHARQRKRTLRDIFEAVEQNQFEVAARLCLQRFHDRSLRRLPFIKRLPKTQSYPPVAMASKNFGMSSGWWLKPASISRIQSAPAAIASR